MKITRLFQFAMILSLFTFAYAATPDYKVSMRVVENGEELASPSMLIEEGADASISLAGDHPVSIGLVVTEQGSDEFHLHTEIETSSNEISPELLVRQGEWASVAVDEFEFHVMVEDHAAGE